ncbi:MAG: hypothetical protein ACYTBZ_03200 [Planctomycetota bacterium]
MTAIGRAVTGINMKKPFKTKLRWIWAALAAVIAVSLGTGWLMFQHIPSWYRPLQIPPANHQKIRDDLTYTYNQINVSINKSNHPFEYRLTQDQINAWLAIKEKIWPASRKWLPAQLTEPFISIDKDTIRLAATYRRGKLKTVLSAQLKAQANQKGILLRLLEVSGGSLNTPQAWVRKRLKKIDSNVWPAQKHPKYQYGNQKLPQLSQLYNGIMLPNAWVWQIGKRPFRIIGLKLENGAAVITFQPITRHPSSRCHSQTASAPATNVN